MKRRRLSSSLCPILLPAVITLGVPMLAEARVTSDGQDRRPTAPVSADRTCPDIFEVNFENKYWAKAMSAFQLDGSGKDLPDPPNVTNYFLSTLPHVPGAAAGICQQPRNPLAPNPVLRALLVAMDQWVSAGLISPVSRWHAVRLRAMSGAADQQL